MKGFFHRNLRNWEFFDSLNLAVHLTAARFGFCLN
jgi:hypothetical protein